MRNVGGSTRKSPIFRSRFAAAAREGAAKPDHNRRPILSRNRLPLRRRKPADSRGEEEVVVPDESSVGREKASRQVSWWGGVMKQFAVNGELAAFDCCAPMQRKDWSG